MSLAGEVTTDGRVKLYNLCKSMHCLPSQLEKEDAKIIEEFRIIENELYRQSEDKNREMEAEARLKGMM